MTTIASLALRAVALGALALPLPALAADAPAVPAAPVVIRPVVVSPAAPAEVDAARLTAAQVTVDHIMPAGIFMKLMNGPMSQLMNNMLDSMGAIPTRDIADAFGAKPEDVARMSKDGSIGELLQIYDPNFKQRINAAMQVILPMMSKMMNDIEPGMRHGLTRAYARRFTTEQLGDMNRFFDTPSGSAYAANLMLIQMDPEVMKEVMTALPKAMKDMMAEAPTLEKKMKEATASLPKPREWKDFTPAERTRLAQLLGIPEAQLAKQAQAAAARKAAKAWAQHKAN